MSAFYTVYNHGCNNCIVSQINKFNQKPTSKIDTQA